MSRYGAIWLAFFCWALYGCQAGERAAREGIELLHSGNAVSALDRFDRALAAQPNHPLALFGKGMILSRSEATRPLARRYLEAAIKRLPDPGLQTEAFVELLRIANLEQNSKTALQVYESALAEERLSVALFLEAYRMPPQKQIKVGDILLRGLTYFPQEVKLHLAYAEHLYRQEKKPGAAAAHLQAQIDNGLQDMQILFAAAEYYYFDKKIEKAIGLLSSAGAVYSSQLERMKLGNYSRGEEGEQNK